MSFDCAVCGGEDEEDGGDQFGWTALIHSLAGGTGAGEVKFEEKTSNQESTRKAPPCR